MSSSCTSSGNRIALPFKSAPQPQTQTWLVATSASQRAPDPRAAPQAWDGTDDGARWMSGVRATHRVLWALWHVRHVRTDERRAFILPACTKRGAESGAERRARWARQGGPTREFWPLTPCWGSASSTSTLSPSTNPHLSLAPTPSAAPWSARPTCCRIRRVPRPKTGPVSP